jgi:hypothetical protein
MPFGCQSEVGKIKRLLLKHPKDAFVNSENILLRKIICLHFCTTFYSLILGCSPITARIYDNSSASGRWAFAAGFVFGGDE